eukprot:COSAG05_NODE_347_length_10963_cov_157.340943_4_plen_177_part_00
MLVFTSKMAVGQVLELLKPWIALKMKNSLLERADRKIAKKLEQAANLGQYAVESTLTLVTDEMGSSEEAKARMQAEQKRLDKMEARMVLRAESEKETMMEKMSYADTYEGTFDSFSEMAIQFGYLALFGVIYPLARELLQLPPAFHLCLDPDHTVVTTLTLRIGVVSTTVSDQQCG